MSSAATLAPMPAGRPPQDGERRDRMLRVRCTADQEARWRALADSLGEDLSTLIRDLLDEADAKAAKR